MKIKRFILISLAMVTLTSCQLSKPPQDGTLGSTENVTHVENDVLYDIGTKKVRPSVADLVQVPNEPETHAPIAPGTYGTEESQGLEYQLEGDSYTVAGMGTCTDTLLVIPSVHEGLPVKAVGNDAFKEQNQITSVIIPEGVEEIRGNAFYACSVLRNIQLPSTLHTIQAAAFLSCKSLVEIVIPEGVVEISQFVFANCYDLQQVTLPSTIRKLDFWAFQSCEKLHSINLPEGLEVIEGCVFSGCHALKNIHVPSSIKKISNSSLRNFEDLSQGGKIIPDGWIHNLYYDGTMEQFLELSSNKENTRMFEGAVNFYIDGDLVEYLTVTEDMKIPEAAFSSCQSLKGVILPERFFNHTDDPFSVISEWAFADCPNLEWVVVQSSLPEDELFNENTCWLMSVMPQYSVSVINRPEIISTVESIALFVTETEEKAAPYLTAWQYFCNEDFLMSSRMPSARIYYADEWEFNADGMPIIK